ncbi:pelle-like serine/threonine-protein kinase pik-1 [Argonauta hians]
MLLKYIPYQIILDIKTLDFDNGWKEIAAEINFSVRDIRDFERCESPTETLIRSWSSQNVTVFDLYKVLHKTGRYMEMKDVEKIVKEENLPLLNIPGETHASNANQASNFSAVNLDSIEEINPTELPTPSQLELNQCIQKPVKSNTHKYSPQSSNVNLQTSASSLQSSTNLDMRMNLEDITCAYPYQEIESATQGFSQCIGKGTFGSVYYGILKSTKCAIKKLSKDLNGTNEAISILKKNPLDEMKMLLRHRHDNIINIYGYCFHKDDIYFVYEFMDKGSLQDCLLDDRDCLNWRQRLDIARGVACGLNYLHSQIVPVIHGDIKSCNILINKHKEAKIGDLGLAEFLTDHSAEFLDRVSKRKDEKLFGTLAYLPPEFAASKGKRFLETDVYSYGVVLLEIITGKLAFHGRYAVKTLVEQLECSLEGKDKEMWYEESDQRIQCHSKSLITKLFDIAFKCISTRRKDRPPMGEVLQNLTVLESEFLKVDTTTVPEPSYPMSSDSCQSSVSCGSCISNFDPIKDSKPYQIQRSWDEKNWKKAESLSQSNNCADRPREPSYSEEPDSETSQSRDEESDSTEDESCQDENKTGDEDFSENIQSQMKNFFINYEKMKDNYPNECCNTEEDNSNTENEET